MNTNRLKCWFVGHTTRIVEGEHWSILGCLHCGYVESVSPLLRPELQHRITAQHAAQMREREERALAMSGPTRMTIRRVK